MNPHRPLYLEILLQTFEHRRAANARYSLRGFAKSLGMRHGTLSLILSGKRVPSKTDSDRLPIALKLSDDLAAGFRQSIAESKRQRTLVRANHAFSRENPLGLAPVKEISIEQFASIADWRCSAILELARIEGFEISVASVVDQLGVPPEEAADGIERLIGAGLFVVDETGRTRARDDFLIATGDRTHTSDVLRRRQVEILKLSQRSVERDPLGVRSHSDLTMAIDPDKLPEARRMIEDFSRSLCHFLQSGSRKRVYELTVSLFPIQRSENEKGVFP